MDLLPLFNWFETTGVGAYVRASLWLFPVIEAFHLCAFAVIGGAILLVDLRMLGLALTDRPTSAVAGDAHPWLLASLVVMLVSGTLLFLSEAVKCYYSQPFWIKMGALVMAMAFTFTVRSRAARADTQVGGLWPKLVAVVSLVLWSTVAWGGRWIGFSG